MQLNKSLLLLIGLIQSYREYIINQGMLQENEGDDKVDWYSQTNKYYYDLNKKYFKAAGIVQNEWYFRQILHFDISREIDKTDYQELNKFYFPDESQYKENTISSFFFYMWNAWCEQECKTVYEEYKHFWSKWCFYTQDTTRGAVEKFYAELSDNYRVKLVSRACEVYNGRAKR